MIISGGGTGGHIFPAIAIANSLREQDPQTEILFVGAKDRMEMEMVPAAGYEIEGLWISGLQRKLTMSNLLFPIKLLSSLVEASRIIKKFKPDVAIGVGGYASGPLLYAASVNEIPCLIQEQNSFAGLTNKWLSGRVDKICVAYDGMEKYFPKSKIIKTGNPVRSGFVNLEEKKQEGFDSFDLNPGIKTVLVIGGSLGARTINESIFQDIHRFRDENIQLIWQTGKSFYEKARGMEAPNIKVFEFIKRMDLAYAVANMVVSRAGAISVSELCVVGKPVILVPSPNVTDDHQTKNAMALVERDAAILVKDAEAREQLIPKIFSLHSNEGKKQQLRMNISRLAIPDATDRIIHEIKNLINNRKN